mmetsp:Transcript_17763/g.31763  ORF Transcript_17763/g.31763 Transcript_17763/m.31763 type:complete len:209 (+) Transcript_17763:342-968(+)
MADGCVPIPTCEACPQPARKLGPHAAVFADRLDDASQPLAFSTWYGFAALPSHVDFRLRWLVYVCCRFRCRPGVTFRDRRHAHPRKWRYQCDELRCRAGSVCGHDGPSNADAGQRATYTNQPGNTRGHTKPPDEFGQGAHLRWPTRRRHPECAQCGEGSIWPILHGCTSSKPHGYDAGWLASSLDAQPWSLRCIQSPARLDPSLSTPW